MNKNTFKTVKLAKGEANVYDFGAISEYSAALLVAYFGASGRNDAPAP